MQQDSHNRKTAKEAEKTKAMNSKEEIEGEPAEEEDRRREAAMASNPCLQPNFMPTGSTTQQQISKFQELRRRRLQIKSKSKIHMKLKGGKSHRKDYNGKDSEDTESSTSVEDSTVTNLKSCNNHNSSSIRPDEVVAEPAQKKRQKLHWGLDTRERWERKANM